MSTATRSDRGSMALAMLVTLVGILVSAALVPVVVTQIGGTRAVSGRTQELQAAQAGLDMALGHLRGAIGTSGAGDLELLPPCTMKGSAGSGWSYQVTITYYKLGDDASEPEPQACPPIYVPVTATLSATGGRTTGSLAAGSPGTRTVEATYTFKTTNENITGGAMQLAAPAVNPLCMDAGPDASPVAGSRVKMQLCKAGGSSDQRFAYTSDLNIKLVGSETSDAQTGMCIEVPYPRQTGDAAVFQPCLGLAPKQQWSLNDTSNFASTRENQVYLGDFCLNLKSPGAAGSDIVLGGCGGGDNVRNFRPQTGVGAGMASAKVGQLVNYKQFSRCLDITGFNMNALYMIVWFCKQSPDGNVPSNQKWTIPAQLTTMVGAVPKPIRSPGSGYCLKSPGSIAAGMYVTMGACGAGTLTDPSLNWYVMGDTDNYTTSYRIMDSYGYCLTPTDLTVTSPDTHYDGTAKVKVAVCSKSELQKWNAPADLNEPLALTNTREK